MKVNGLINSSTFPLILKLADILQHIKEPVMEIMNPWS